MKQPTICPPEMDQQEVSKYSILIVASEYNKAITDKQVATASAFLQRLGVNNVKIIRVPGVFEIPIATQWALEKSKYDAVVVLGCAIRGETEHFNQIISSCTRGIEQLMLDTQIPISDGVLTVDSISQAEERISRAEEAVSVALKMAILKSHL